MPKLLNVVAATAFLALAAFTFMLHGSPWMIGLFFAASVYLYVLAFTGLSAGLSDVHDAVGFIQDPAEAIMDHATDQLFPDDEADRGAKRASPLDALRSAIGGDEHGAGNKEFDPDAAIARHLAAKRAERAQAAAAPAHPAMPHRPVFGRRTS